MRSFSALGWGRLLFGVLACGRILRELLWWPGIAVSMGELFRHRIGRVVAVARDYTQYELHGTARISTSPLFMLKLQLVVPEQAIDSIENPKNPAERQL